mmetsp:Transcript_58278/g.103494  ORF Transcript_58278/g.103494 Transcript_58278/m.103494 type:complete len:476 (-) Transcript_58278:60-1487(-)|eukprot:CAMPEP_0197628756 /NCGR_PEP_ID=MMETSP1338-20131121/6918_1 /TAXON_ID=43686 ORGANISM="Pelagodinium beii, Strain RCC1491" /NCGR_SAMPLE_ID=MMETSP1338 /ASSEMBLY_ACC=CAM_ASM_000754 /LENGTH=475 /DNA_ID=CAMNT_0043199749 /DNA_START=59 /DNA_END=1486 /DNA_ORIENTATION=+
MAHREHMPLREAEGFFDSSPWQARSFVESDFSPKATVARSPLAKRLPREGPSEGDGEMRVTKREWLQSALSAAGIDSEEPLQRLPSQAGRSKKSLGASTSMTQESWALGSSPSTRRTALGGSQSTPALGATAPVNGRWSWGAREAEVRKKQERMDQLRQQDQQRIADKVERRKDLRESRASRLLASTSGNFGADYETAMQLRTWAGKEEERLRDLHSEREKEVFDAIDDRLQGYLHWEQARKQQALMGQRNVAFPDSFQKEVARHLTPKRLEERDPVHRPQYQHAEEEAFHREATQVIQGLSRTAYPEWWQEPSSPHKGMPAKAMSREVLEPGNWEPIRLQGTMWGNNERLFDNPMRGTWGPGDPIGQGATVLKRGGPGMFVPHEADGVEAAGKRTIRSGPHAIAHHDTGMLALRGGVGGAAMPAMLGEAVLHRSSIGASSGAPMQDHYTYERGPRVTDMEFPIGKRIFTGFPYH